MDQRVLRHHRRVGTGGDDDDGGDAEEDEEVTVDRASLTLPVATTPGRIERSPPPQ
jgi:hypothetical protein